MRPAEDQRGSPRKPGTATPEVQRKVGSAVSGERESIGFGLDSDPMVSPSHPSAYPTPPSFWKLILLC